MYPRCFYFKLCTISSFFPPTIINAVIIRCNIASQNNIFSWAKLKCFCGGKTLTHKKIETTRMFLYCGRQITDSTCSVPHPSVKPVGFQSTCRYQFCSMMFATIIRYISKNKNKMDVFLQKLQANILHHKLFSQVKK